MYTQSGDATPTWATAPKELARKRAFTFGGLVGCEHDTSEELLECLQNNLDVDTIINNQSNEVCVLFLSRKKYVHHWDFFPIWNCCLSWKIIQMC